VLYWTAATDLHGELHFYRDIYQRDAALLDVLDRGRSPAPDGRE
jgi:murein L,D-transpeptidase YcbB/YkuD